MRFTRCVSAPIGKPWMVALAFLLVTGCATSADPSIGVGGTDTVLNATRGRSAVVGGGDGSMALTRFEQPAETVWAALLKALPALGIPIDAVSTQTLTAGTPATQAKGRFAGQRISTLLACGGAAGVTEVADAYAMTIGVLATVARAESGSTLEVQVAGAAKDPFTSVPARHCTTRGRLEAQVDSAVRAMTSVDSRL